MSKPDTIAAFKGTFNRTIEELKLGMEDVQIVESDGFTVY